MKNHYLKIFKITALILLLSLTFVSIAYAVDQPEKEGGVKEGVLGWIGGFALEGIAFLVAGINYIIAHLAGILVTLAGFLVNWALDLNARVLDSQVVKTGWIISRDLANLGFVLAIIIISFATILRIQTYEAKKLLTRLIIAALLVNFSLVIAGVFVDFSGMLTNFFVDEAGSGSTLAAQLTGGLRVHELLKIRVGAEEKMRGIQKDFKAAIVFIASIFFVAIFSITAAIALFGLAFMFFIRYIALVILLILAPLAWLFWILPDFAHLWTKWWQNFFKWIWFAPAASFFVYLAIILVKKEGGSLGIVDSQGALSVATAMDDPGGVIGQMIAVIGLLVGGLIVAQNMSIVGASATLQAAGKARNMILGAPGAGARAFGRGIREAGYKKPQIDPKTGKPIAGTGGSWLQRQSAKFTGVPLVGGAAQAVNQWATTGREARRESFDKDLAQLAKDKAAFMNAGKDSLKMRDDAYAAQYIKTAADQGFLKDLKAQNPRALEEGIQAARREGVDKEIYKKNPMLAKLGRNLELPEEREAATKDIEDTMAKIASKDLGEMSAEAFESPEISLNLTKSQVKYLAQNATGKQEEAMIKILEKWKKEMETGGPEWNALNVERQRRYRMGIDKLDKMLAENPAANAPRRIGETWAGGAGI